jgi:3-dehydroquinate dehydratase-1
LQRDGGKIPDQDFALRFADWERICMAPQHPHWIDVEQILIDQLTREIDLAHAQGIRVLVSQHNFQRVPSLPRLRAQAQQARAAGAQGFKIAAMSKHVGDTTRLYSFARKECRHFEWLAAFAMGATGQASRVRSLRCGANLTYAALGKAVAPGQLTAMEMRQKIAHLKP